MAYLNQLKKSDKLDFASWGGFAQNFAGRRIPFENPALTGHWEKARAENLFIPTFASGLAGPYVPATSIKGALRTGLVFTRWSKATIEDVSRRIESDRMFRRVSAHAENAALGSSGADRMKFIAAADSAPAPVSSLKVYLLRASTLQARGGGKYELGWKQSPRGSVGRADDATPIFAEMAVPGTVFEGDWKESEFLKRPDIARALHWKPPDRKDVIQAANEFAQAQITAHRGYAAAAGLSGLDASLSQLETQLSEARAKGDACLVSIGWGGGFVSKVAYIDTQDPTYREVLKTLPFYSRAIQTGMPFPKTRRIVFQENRPATLPGWALLEVSESDGRTNG